jgi:hypothetical protein
LTLRPYSKWVWKKVAEEEQYLGYEWKVPSNSNVINFTRADKTDNQLNETYTYYHGQASRTGEFDLQLTDNGTVVKTIHVTVIDDVAPMSTFAENFISRLESLTGNKRSSVAIVSDGNYLREQSVVLLGPGPITSGEKNEFVSKFSYETLIELYTKLLKETCF